MFCKYCGFELKDSVTFCPKCGKALGGNAAGNPYDSGENVNGRLNKKDAENQRTDIKNQKKQHKNKKQNKRKMSAFKKVLMTSGIVLCIAIVLFVAGFIYYLCSPAKKIADDLANGDYSSIVSIYKWEIKDHFIQEALLKQLMGDEIQNVMDQYNEGSMDYEEAKEALEALQQLDINHMRSDAEDALDTLELFQALLEEENIEVVNESETVSEPETVNESETETESKIDIENGENLVRTFENKISRAAQEGVLDAGSALNVGHLKEVLSNTGADYSSFILDVSNYEVYDTGHCDLKMYASALIGVPILFTIADGLDKGYLSLSDSVRFSYSVYGRGKMTASQDGQFFTLKELINEAFMYSDNNAINSLIDYLSLDTINSTCHQYGYISVDIQRKIAVTDTSLENYISAKDAVLMINAMYQNNFSVINKNFLLNTLKMNSDDTANKGMYPVLKNSDIFLNFNGITDSRYTEIGVIERDGRIFIMCILMDGISSDKEADAVSEYAGYVNNRL